MTTKRPCCWPHCLESAKAPLPLCEMHTARVWWHVNDSGNKPPRQITSTSEVGLVYYLRVGDRIKIGWTSDLDKRLRSYPPGRELLATEPGTRADEKAMHQRCTPWRCDGREWYTPCEGIDNVIAEARRNNGQRARLTALTRTFERRPGARDAPTVRFSDSASLGQERT